MTLQRSNVPGQHRKPKQMACETHRRLTQGSPLGGQRTSQRIQVPEEARVVRPLQVVLLLCVFQRLRRAQGYRL